MKTTMMLNHSSPTTNAAAETPQPANPLTPQAVIDRFDHVMHAHNGHPTSTQIANLKNEFAVLNAQGCPSNDNAPAASPDFNGDGHVNQADLEILMSQWGQAGMADMDHDGVFGPADLLALLRWWGR